MLPGAQLAAVSEGWDGLDRFAAWAVRQAGRGGPRHNTNPQTRLAAFRLGLGKIGCSLNKEGVGGFGKYMEFATEKENASL